jgi:hypothetical protein
LNVLFAHWPYRANKGKEEAGNATKMGLNSGVNSREAGELIRQACRRL